MPDLGPLRTTYPQLQERLDAYVMGVWRDPALPEGVLELCRIRIATLLGATAAARVRLLQLPTALEAGAARIESWSTADELGATERACLAFAEQFVLDAQALDEVTVEAVRSRVGEQGLALLVVGVGLAEGLTRAQLAWGVPWGSART
jgi:alkylhydroperoxidase family enzyme